MKYRYHIAGRGVRSVTEILGELLPQYQAPAWYLQRGQAVHACCAMIARGQEFDSDPQIAGQVEACRAALWDLKPVPIEVEVPHTSERYQYAGTPDMLCHIGGKRVVLDYKASLTPVVPLQLGGYAELIGDVVWGMGIELREDGTYTTTGLLDLRIPRREFLALRTVYGIRERLGMLTRKESEEA